MKYDFQELILHLKNNGFIFQGSEIYGGLSNTWDYGPLGVKLKNNIKKLWWKFFIDDFDFNFGLDSSILMNPKVWEASGHLNNFSDPLIDCKNCKFRFRPDKILSSILKNIDISSLSMEEIEEQIKDKNIKCPNCSKTDFTKIRQFELMFRIKNSITSNSKNDIFLRPETAQGIFINFKNVQRTMSAKLPMGIGQIGKTFRNEITPGNFIFRTREFEQMELEFFYSKYDDNNWFNFWLENVTLFLSSLGILKKNLFIREHSKKELAHYSSKTVDIEYDFPFGRGELWGISDRGTFDLESHSKVSGENLKYFDELKKEKYFPKVIEPSVGVERLMLAILCDAYSKQKQEKNDRIILKLDKNIAPFQICVLPLVKKLDKDSKIILNELKKSFSAHSNISGSIGKRYRKEDSIGTPYCVTFDYDSLKDKKVTIRDRDTMLQTRINIDEVKVFLFKKFNSL